MRWEQVRALTGGLLVAVLVIPAATSAIQGRELRPDPEVRVPAKLAAMRAGGSFGAVHPVAGHFSYGGAGALFGAARPGHSHAGQDMLAPTGTPLVAVRDGVVIAARWWSGYGNFVAIYSPFADRTYNYAHLAAPTEVAIGQQVRAGQRLGIVGCTGACSGPHLHFEIRRGRGERGAPIDPLPELRDWRVAP